MKTNLLILSKAGIIGVASLMLTGVTLYADIEDNITKSFKVHQGGQLVVAVDRGSFEFSTSVASLHPGDIEDDVGFSRPLVDTPWLAD